MLKGRFKPHKVCERAVLAVLKNEKELVLVLKFSVQLDNERLASQFLQDLPFSDDCLFLIQFHYLGYMEVFNSDKPPGRLFNR